MTPKISLVFHTNLNPSLMLLSMGSPFSWVAGGFGPIKNKMITAMVIMMIMRVNVKVMPLSHTAIHPMRVRLLLQSAKNCYAS